MLDYWFWVSAPLLAFMGIGLLIYAMGRHPRKREPGKEEPYTGGEDLPDIRVQPDNFYQAIRKTLRLKRLQDMHTGDLSDYLIWVLVGLAALLILVVGA